MGSEMCIRDRIWSDRPGCVPRGQGRRENWPQLYRRHQSGPQIPRPGDWPDMDRPWQGAQVDSERKPRKVRHLRIGIRCTQKNSPQLRAIFLGGLAWGAELPSLAQHLEPSYIAGDIKSAPCIHRVDTAKSRYPNQPLPTEPKNSVCVLWFNPLQAVNPQHIAAPSPAVPGQ